MPPVPQIPSTHQSTTAATAAQDEKPSKSLKASADNNQLLDRIDSVIESQLQFHLGQIVWRASESHLDARRFWDEQKKEMFGIAATLIDRMETQVDMQRRMTFESITSASPIEKEEVNIVLQQKELSLYKSKYTEAKRQLFELEVLKTRNVELEKQHETDLKTLKQLKKEIAQQKPHAKQDSAKEVIDDKPTYDLIAKNKQLKNQLEHLQEINRQLLEQTTAYEQDKKRHTLEIKQLSEQLSQQQQQQQQSQRKIQPSASTTTTVDGIDCSEDFGKTKKKPSKQMDNWADMMQSEDEAKKSADEWAQKYRELQASYFEACMKLEKKQVHSDDEKKMFDLNQSLKEKDEIIRHLKQAEEVDKIQLNYLQMELNKCHEKKKKKTPPVDNGGYTTEDGYLTFTTEINGQPSRYTIKIPSVNHSAPHQQQRRSPAAFKPTTTSSQKTHLNPNACEWKKSKTKN